MTILESPSAAAPELPVHLTRFVGRDRELDELARLIEGTRLLTLTGAGGSGKTRLATELASRIADTFARVAWVDLVPVDDASLIAPQAVVALHCPDRPGVTPHDLLLSAVGRDRVLLVLDNCEHLVDACASLGESLLRSCPQLTILATSREALGVASETAWLVPPLASPEAVQLFVERAQATQPSFALSQANASALGEICRRLDGIPLAIELAAARVRVLSPEQIARRLDDAFRLLTGGSRTALPRHRTLRATMEWSYNLLGAREQVLLRRLAAFPSTFTLDAAEVVCAGPPLEAEDILDGVAALVDRSLVVMEPGDGEARYRLLETVRQYGAERLADAYELETIARRHAEHFLAMAEEAAPNLVGGSNAPGILARLHVEHDNVRVAAQWAVADERRADVGLRFAGALYWYWYATGQFREARQVIDRALAHEAESDPLIRGRALESSALTALAQGDYPLSMRHFVAALELLRAGGQVTAFTPTLAKYGAAQLLGGDVADGIATLDETLLLTRDLPPNDMAVIFARFWRGWAAYMQREYDLAYALVSRNAGVGRDFALPTTRAHSLVTLARIELARDNVEQACALVGEGLELEVTIADAWGTGLALEVVALVAWKRGRLEDAARLLGGLYAHRERLAVALPGIAPDEREEMLASLRLTLGTRFESLYDEGLALPTASVVSLALSEAARHTTEHRIVSPEGVARQSAEAPARLRVLALGPLQVAVGERVVDSSAWGSARPRELLVYLLMHPDGRTKEQVGIAFWPDASSAQLRNNFHVTLHRLRKALGGPDWIVLEGDRYRVADALVAGFDARDLPREVAEARRALRRREEGAAARLEQALAGYRGDLLDGEPVGDWHLEWRDQLQRLYVDAMMELAARHAEEERHAKAADTYRRVLARDELHEEALVGLMQSLAELGERSQALRAYRRFAERLRDELDAEPDVAARRLFERLQLAPTG